MSFGTSIAIVLTILKYQLVQGQKLNTAFPSTPQLYSGAYSLSGTRGIGEFQEWLTTQPNTKNEFFTVVDGCEVTLGQIWESMCAYFDIPTSPPSEDGSTVWDVEAFVGDSKKVWNEIVEKYGGKRELLGWGTFDSARSAMSDVQLVASMEKAKAFGFVRPDEKREKFAQYQVKMGFRMRSLHCDKDRLPVMVLLVRTKSGITDNVQCFEEDIHKSKHSYPKASL